MKSTMKKAVAALLLLVVILSVSMPAFAASKWYTYQCGGCNRTRTFSVLVTRNRYASSKLSTRLLTQADGSVNMRNKYTGRWKIVPAKGTYFITVTQTRDAQNRRVNRRICTNRFWQGQYFNLNVTAGTYTVSVRSVGVAVSLTKALQGYETKSWHAYPQYRIG